MRKLKSQKGFALALVSVFALMSSMLAGTYMAMSVNEVQSIEREVNSTAALYLAEAGVERARWELKSLAENGAQLPTVTYPIAYNLNDVMGNTAANFAGVEDVSIVLTPVTPDYVYRVAVSSRVGESTKSLYATLRFFQSASVFDNAYFVNNWGFYHGSPITINGDSRSNGSFSLKHGPTINGKLIAGQDILVDNAGVLGTGGDQDGNGNYINHYDNSEPLKMPNLQDLAIYENLAISQNASISIGGVTIVDGIYGDDTGEMQNLVLIGTVDDPIVIHGPVVIRGDVVIKGVVTGRGTIYSGRNMYVADAITYADGPSQASPDSRSDADVEAWYAAEKNKDIVGFAATESIFLGNFEHGGWNADNYLVGNNGMGAEDVGVDGIPDTGDVGEEDGNFDPATEDIDEDGVEDVNYTWTDIQFQNTFDPVHWGNFPTSGVTTYSDVASNSMTHLDGIYYTNHAFAGHGGGMTFNGAVVSKDEALYINSIEVNYDWRIHSRFTSDDFNWLIELALPVADFWGIEDWQEEAHS